MCYDSLSLTQRSLDYAKRVGYSPETIKELELQFERIKQSRGPIFHSSGFEHTAFPILTQENPQHVDLFLWGLIPSWVKDKKTALSFWNKTLNARSETIFEKASFRGPIKSQRCMVITDGFYEHHHVKSKAYPFLVRHQNNKPMMLAGIYSLWTEPISQLTWKTFCIVTTKANDLMAKVHNNPKMTEGRMPVILNTENKNTWLDPSASKLDLKQLMSQPQLDEDLRTYPIKKLRGKDAVGNQPEALIEKEYPELTKFW